MNLGKQMIEQLQRLVAEPTLATASSDGAYATLTVGDGEEHARLEIFDHDRYSVTLRALEVGSVGPFEGDARAYLSAHAAMIARRMSYLEEPLAVWELDDVERVVQLRSSPPQREGETLSYWEVVLRIEEQPSARIARYRWAPGMVERETVTYPATFALIGRMADSLAAGLRAIDE